MLRVLTTGSISPKQCSVSTKVERECKPDFLSGILSWFLNSYMMLYATLVLFWTEYQRREWEIRGETDAERIVKLFNQRAFYSSTVSIH